MNSHRSAPSESSGSVDALPSTSTDANSIDPARSSSSSTTRRDLASYGAPPGSSRRTSKLSHQDRHRQREEEEDWDNRRYERPFLRRRPASQPNNFLTPQKRPLSETRQVEDGPAATAAARGKATDYANDEGGADVALGAAGAAPSSNKKSRLRRRGLTTSIELPENRRPTTRRDSDTSPLFFSNSPRQRPIFPRFRSSDAGAITSKATIMEKAGSEAAATLAYAAAAVGTTTGNGMGAGVGIGTDAGADTGADTGMMGPGVASSGSIRSPSSAASPRAGRALTSGFGASGRITTSPTRRFLSDRMLLSESNLGGAASSPSAVSVARSTPGPRDEQRIRAALQALDQVGVMELLEQDDRPSFVLDLGYPDNFQPGPLHFVFANAPLRAFGILHDLTCGKIVEDSSGLENSIGFAEFKAWATSFVQNGESMDVSLPTFTFAAFMWTSSTLRKRFRVFYGVPFPTQSIRASSPLRAPASNHAAPSSVTVDATGQSAEEPKDYFGNFGRDTPMHDSGSVGTKASPGAGPTSAGSATARSTEPRPSPRRSQPQSPSKSQTAHAHQHHHQHHHHHHHHQRHESSTPDLMSAEPSPLGTRPNEALLRAASAGQFDAFPFPSSNEHDGLDWTRKRNVAALPRHLQFARSVDWAATSLGPIEGWSTALRSASNMLMSSPHPAALYWGPDFVSMYNEPYILLAGMKHPMLMGQPYRVAWREIWDDLKEVFVAAVTQGQSTMKDDDRIFIDRSGFLEETYFSWSLIPIIESDGTVAGLFNPAFEKTRRALAERRMLTLRAVGETTAAAREVKSFWGQVLKGLERNEYDTPFVLLYSIADEDSDDSSMHSSSVTNARRCVLVGSLPAFPEDHPAAPPDIDLRDGKDGFGPAFREALTLDKPILLETSNGTLDPALLENIEWRGFPEEPRAAVVCAIHPTTGDSVLGFIVMGINPRRPYDDDYNLFVQLLSRQLATSVASVVLFEEEIRRGQRAARLAAQDRIELSEQLEAKSKEAEDSRTKFTRMVELAPVGMFIADCEGRMAFTNDTFHSLSGLPKGDDAPDWMDMVNDEDRQKVEAMWDTLIRRKKPAAAEFRFNKRLKDRNGNEGDTWVLGSAHPELDVNGELKRAFGSITDISQQKWVEDIQKRRVEEAVELKRQQSNFMDMTSHEMRNPLSAILQCADEISGSLLELKATSIEENGDDGDGDDESYRISAALLDSNIDAAQTIALCANHQTRIVSDVLTLSKLDSHLLLVTPVDTRPAMIVQQVLKMFEGELHTADIKMEFKTDQSVEDLRIDWVRADPSRLLQVLINLITNAIKFTTTQANRAIIISLSASLDRPSSMPSSGVSYIPSRSKQADITEGKDWGGGEVVYLSFAVQDTGKGLTEPQKKLLFLRFSQASPKTHVEYGGSGLGLFISRQLVELQGGEIGAASTRGKGSTFAFYIKARRSNEPARDGLSDPAAAAGGYTNTVATRKPSASRLARGSSPVIESVRPAEATPAPPPPLSKDNPPGSAKIKTPAAKTTATSTKTIVGRPHHREPRSHLHVLVVEDNLVNQQVLTKQLRGLGCAVEVANHGEECIDLLKRTRHWRGNPAAAPDLSVILMDLEMPVMDGLTCTRLVRKLQRDGDVVRHLPIIAVSANARSAHIESALEAGMDDVVSKPFRIPELMPKIDQLVAKYGTASKPEPPEPPEPPEAPS